ncbi:MAG: type IV pilus modification protein PilV [Undibacterium sp.]|nr:type IV pilus modification protein PilV [Undibacterium sp.]
MKHFISSQRQSGSSLIEVMISIFVMAVGLLGLASLQVNSMKFEKSSSQRAEASQAAYDLSERMRANAVNAALNYSYLADYATSHVATHTPPNTCNAGVCTDQQIAANDLADWLRGLQRRIAGGTGYVAVVPGTSVLTFDVAIMWNEQGLSVPDANCPAGAAAPVGVRCFVYRVMP